ncbi:TetR/AcrR family transcriptional regulator [Dactylosporangium sp. NPDC005555]|uniref:TetR/AcrR family transcriptional regulator n=1 Tax=Dactylosporangium sp. NPDC005555 TaxID=3154889 RepID=UPI0033B22A9D
MAVKRRYDASGRQRQALRTRAAILDAAGLLFVRDGYAATPLTAVAAEAGVAIQTVYAVFGTKRQLLSDLVDRTIAGDDEPVALADRQFVADIQALSDPRAKLERYARHLAETHARQAEIMRALAGAATADPDAAAILAKNETERRQGMRRFAAELVATGGTDPALTAEQVTDVLWLAMDWHNHDWLVRRCGWSEADFQRWYVRTTAAAILVG